jgi:hypothetical protein
MWELYQPGSRRTQVLSYLKVGGGAGDQVCVTTISLLPRAESLHHYNVFFSSVHSLPLQPQPLLSSHSLCLGPALSYIYVCVCTYIYMYVYICIYMCTYIYNIYILLCWMGVHCDIYKGSCNIPHHT